MALAWALTLASLMLRACGLKSTNFPEDVQAVAPHGVGCHAKTLK